MACSETNAGNCGGSYNKQIYATTLKNKNTANLVENFILHNREMNKMSEHIDMTDKICQKPLDKYILMVLIMIVMLLLYMVIEYINKK